MAVTSGVCVRTIYNFSRIARSLTVSNGLPRQAPRYLSTVKENQEARTGEKATDKAEPKVATGKEEAPATESKEEQKLKEENVKLQADIKDMKDKYMRSLAETENVRTRMKKQVDDAKVFGIQGFCKDIIDVADILGQAMDSTPKEEIKSSNPHLKGLFEGLTLTHAQMLKVFQKHGLNQIAPSEGDKFDPFLHEAVFEVPTSDKQGGSIAVIQKKGYKLHERTIRPAVVGVFKSTG